LHPDLSALSKPLHPHFKKRINILLYKAFVNLLLKILFIWLFFVSRFKKTLKNL